MILRVNEKIEVLRMNKLKQWTVFLNDGRFTYICGVTLEKAKKQISDKGLKKIEKIEDGMIEINIDRWK